MTKTRVNMNLDKDISKKLRHIAIDEETTVTEIITTLIINYVEKYEYDYEYKKG